jgi:hypothetical protein
VKNINVAEQFDPNNDQVTLKIQTPFSTYQFTLAQNANLSLAIARLTPFDKLRALEAARRLRPQAAHAFATLALSHHSQRTEAEQRAETERRAREEAAD